MIRVALRFDDPSATSDRILEASIISALEESGLQATFAIIPFSNAPTGRIALDAGSGALLMAAHKRHVFEVALHGNCHRRLKEDGKPSEFFGLPVYRQSALLNEAAESLRALFGPSSVRGFVPPWNSYDVATLVSLDTLGFAYISAGRWCPTNYDGPLTIVPRTCQFNALETAVAEARRYARLEAHVVAVLHHYDFHESGETGSTIDLRKFTDSLTWLKRQPDIQVMNLRDMAALGRDGVFARPLKGWLREEELHWRLRARLPKHCLIDAPIWRLLFA